MPGRSWPRHRKQERAPPPSPSISQCSPLPSPLADVISTSTAQATSIYQVLDNSADKGLNVAYNMLGKVAKREFYELGHMFWDALNTHS